MPWSLKFDQSSRVSCCLLAVFVQRLQTFLTAESGQSDTRGANSSADLPGNGGHARIDGETNVQLCRVPISSQQFLWLEDVD